MGPRSRFTVFRTLPAWLSRDSPTAARGFGRRSRLPRSWSAKWRVSGRFALSSRRTSSIISFLGNGSTDGLMREFVHHLASLARSRSLSFASELGDEPDPVWAPDIDQVIFRGSFVMEEVAFFHRVSCTAIIGDLVQRHPESKISGWKGMLMRLDGLVGKCGSTPREWRATFLRRSHARAVLGWSTERLLIAHGECAKKEATRILARALAWI